MKKYRVDYQVIKLKGSGIEGVSLADTIKEFDTIEDTIMFTFDLDVLDEDDLDYNKEYGSYTFWDDNDEVLMQIYVEKVV